jgi:hypothetical protein
LELTQGCIFDFHLSAIEHFILILLKHMDHRKKVAIVTAGTFGAVGAGVLAIVGNPVAWGALAYATYRIAKSAYDKAPSSAKLKGKEAQDTDLFI